MNKLKVGNIITMSSNKEAFESEFRRTANIGLNCVQIASWYTSDRDEDMLNFVKDMLKKYSLELTSLWVGWTPIAPNGGWNYTMGPQILGLVPHEYREHRLAELRQSVNFAKRLDITDIVTHVGYLPENPNDSNYTGVVIALKILCEDLKRNGMYFDFETGQETPVTVLRAIEDIGMNNCGVNFDPSNLITYGKANPCDAMDILGKYVRGIHVKDGLYPTGGYVKGIQTRIGEGKVNWPRLMGLLNEYKYTGPYIIEREIPPGDEQLADIRDAKEFIEKEYAKYNWDF